MTSYLTLTSNNSIPLSHYLSNYHSIIIRAVARPVHLQTRCSDRCACPSVVGPHASTACVYRAPLIKPHYRMPLVLYYERCTLVRYKGLGS